MRWILAVDTAGTEGCVTLAPAENVDSVREFPLNVRQRHAQVLLPAIREALSTCGVRAADVSVVAVTSGPGSFTGLRVGIMAAKTWAYATGAQLVAIPSLVALFQSWRTNSGPSTGPLPPHVWALENAQRGELFASAFSTDPNAEAAFETPFEIVTPKDLLGRLSTGDTMIGPGTHLWTAPDGDLVDELSPEILAALNSVSQPLSRPSGAVLVRLAAQRVREGNPDSPLTLEPLYLRRSSAEDKWLERQQRQSSA